MTGWEVLIALAIIAALLISLILPAPLTWVVYAVAAVAAGVLFSVVMLRALFGGRE